MKSNRTNPARDIETWAVEIVRFWVGDAGTVYDTGDGNGPDFSINYKSGRTAVGEVGWATDDRRQEQQSLIEKSESRYRVALRSGLGSWWVTLRPDARIKGIDFRLAALIEAALVAGIESCTPEFDHTYNVGQPELVSSTRPSTAKIAATADALGVRSMACFDRHGRDEALILLDTLAGFVPPDPNELVDWVDDYLQRETKRDLQVKLRDYPENEKHVFVVLGHGAEFGVVELVGRAFRALPNRAPILDSWITHLWVAAEWTFERRIGALLFAVHDDEWTYVTYRAEA